MKIYIQIADAPRSYKVKASTTKPIEPLKAGDRQTERFLPTITFAIDAKFDRNIFKEGMKSIAEFELTNEMIQTPSPQVNVIKVDK